MAIRIQIAKFKLRQYLLRTNSPNLMLAKVSRYTVHHDRLMHKFNVNINIIRTKSFYETVRACDHFCLTMFALHTFHCMLEWERRSTG